MCAFSQPVDVSDTLIFARIEGPRQYLVYKMVFSSDEDLAMILPIPVSTGSGEDAVSFISMEDHPDFFNMLSVLFPTPEGEDEVGNVSFEDPVAEEVLNVHQVGYFDASFVPNIQDFSRLDEGFRLPGHVLEQFPGGANYGFVVFKLSKGHTQEVHLWLFRFQRACRTHYFFRPCMSMTVNFTKPQTSITFFSASIPVPSRARKNPPIPQGKGGRVISFILREIHCLSSLPEKETLRML